MKQSIMNIGVWLTAAALFFVLVYLLMADTPAPPVITTVQTEEIATWIQRRQQLEKQLQNLEQDFANASRAPSSIFVLFATQDESVISEASAMLDPLGISALLGVSQSALTQWNQSGLPSYVGERLAAGWEICLVLEETPPMHMQDQLAQLQLPQAICVYLSPKNVLPYDAQELLNCGLRIVIEDSVQTRYTADDGLWHIASLGNMHSEGVRVYEQFRHAGSALVNVIGSYQADQLYMKENLEGLLELIHEDSRLGSVQNLHLDAAMYYQQQYLARLEIQRQEWMENRDILEQELKTVMDKISAASVLLNQ